MRTKVVPIPIVAEGGDWLVVSKPPHLLVHPTRPDGTVTLLDHLRALLACELASGGQVSLIHRLDRETSGLMLVAKTGAAARRFSLEMMRGRIGKEYVALVWGWPDWERAHRRRPAAAAGRKDALRDLAQAHDPSRRHGGPDAVRDRCGDSSATADASRWVRAVPETGRLHQIRVHLAHTGHPVVGDKIYGPDEGCYLRFIETGWTPDLAHVLLMDRHALHAQRLEFDATPGERLTVEDPLPSDMAAFLRAE